MTYADKLRAFADYLDAHSELMDQAGRWDYPSLWLYADDADQFAYLVRQLGGFEKSGYGGQIEAVHTETDDNDDRVFVMRVSVTGVCEQRPVLDDDGNPKVRTIPAQEARPERTEPVTEWVCPQSFLNL